MVLHPFGRLRDAVSSSLALSLTVKLSEIKMMHFNSHLFQLENLKHSVFY